MIVSEERCGYFKYVQPRTTSAYAQEIRPLLSRADFAPARSRLAWLLVHVPVIVGGMWLLSARTPAWFTCLTISLVMGISYAGLTFLGHETLHGAVVRGVRLRRLVGWVGFLHFMVSPRLWEAWHNRVHHGHSDPDAYPTLDEYRASGAVRAITGYAPGASRLRGALTLLVGFTIQSTHMLIAARRRKYLSPAEHKRAIAETLLAATIWLGVALLVGPRAFLFGFALPVMLANAVVMSFILTNHSLSPLTDVNDPLVNSLSVTGPRWFEWLTLGFGYHVEHHLFPAMSARHAPKLRDILRARWPELYQSLPLVAALSELHRTGRVYETPTTLFDPKTGQRWPTLAPKLARARAGRSVR